MTNIKAREIMREKYRQNPDRQRAIKFFNTMKGNHAMNARESTIHKYKEEIKRLYPREFILQSLSSKHASMLLSSQ